MKRLSFVLLCLVVLFAVSCKSKRPGTAKVLVFSKHAGFFHQSIPAGIAAVQKLGRENGFEVDTTENSARFTEEGLKPYSAVIFLNTTGDVLNDVQQTAFERYIQAGGGFVGVHAAADTEYDWKWYGGLVGAYFNGHPKPQAARFVIRDRKFPATEFFTDSVWNRTDELYNYKDLNPDNHVLITIDESSYEGGTNGSFHPMSWYHDYDGGRSFYTALGHTDESYSEDLYLKHLLGGIRYAIGDNYDLDYSKARSSYAPTPDRFTKTQLSTGEFFEPTELTVLPNLDILIVQRRGEVLMYKQETKKIKPVGFINVYWKTTVPGVNAEEGVMGLAKDPKYDKNHWVYIYYSPVDSSINRLSRFTFENDTLMLSSEKVILEVKAQRQICCHTGGSIAFGPDGLLFVSTGDNSTPFDEPGAKYVSHGYGPMNDIPGHQQYDARRSSGNTNDLRGKILRIKVNEDGSYTTPDGNLFPKGTEKTRPEIYVMGNRNPYRISVDQKNGWLYWGEVGPDANRDSLDTRGPRGYDEVNQARKAGFFGWPLFVGNNYPYHEYDYATGKIGPAFDPKKPLNNSRNNTGLRELQPVSPAFIWYPYAPSTDFPQVGTGGRNAMAGPVYYTDMYPKETRLPDYYNGKLIIYEWIRGWIKAVTLKPNGDFDKMEPFFPGIKLNSLIDMEVGPDGRLYLLEYGTGWFTRNPDAGLARIDYNPGNLAPKLGAVHVDRTSGVLPFTIKAKTEAADVEGDKIHYKWDLGNGTTRETETPELDYTYTTAGDYALSVEAIDANGNAKKSDPVALYAGNEVPTVTIAWEGGNKSFYMPGVPVHYTVKVSDPQDPSTIDPSRMFISADYVEGLDKAGSSLGHQQGQAVISGKSLIQSNDCKSCHKENDKSIGPSYRAVSEKYKNETRPMRYLTQKVMNGGSGVWGETAMPAHPTLSQRDAQQMISWILSLSKPEAIKKSLQATGTVTPPADVKPNAVLVLSASYTDSGGENIKALTGSAQATLSSNTMMFAGTEDVKGFGKFAFNGMQLLTFPAGEGWFAVGPVDLSGVKSIDLVAGWQKAPAIEFHYEVKLDSPEGQSIGKGIMPKPKEDDKLGIGHVRIAAPKDGSMHKLYVIFTATGDIPQGAISMMKFNAKD